MMDLKLPHARKEPLPGDVFEPRRFTRGTDEEGLLKNILPGPPGDGDNVGLTRHVNDDDGQTVMLVDFQCWLISSEDKRSKAMALTWPAMAPSGMTRLWCAKP